MDARYQMFKDNQSQVRAVAVMVADINSPIINDGDIRLLNSICSGLKGMKLKVNKVEIKLDNVESVPYIESTLKNGDSMESWNEHDNQNRHYRVKFRLLDGQVKSVIELCQMVDRRLKYLKWVDVEVISVVNQ